MTNEEARDELVQLANHFNIYGVVREALNMAIEALSCSEKPNMSDLISRQAAISAIKKDIMGGLNYESILEDLPSAQPLIKTDLLELEHRFGEFVRFVVEDMLSGEGKRWEKKN